ncbi:MAG: hypothetical protein NC093_01180 [Alistipes sp.]|nr:hypothetical protein [Alistipes sp.]
MAKKKISVLIGAAVLLTGCTFKIGDREIFSFGENGSINTVGTPASFDEVYDEVLECLEDGGTLIEFRRNLDSDVVYKAMNAVEQDHPDLFWVDGYTITNSSTGRKGTLEIDLIHDVDKDELLEMRRELEETAESVIAGIPGNSSDYEKMLYIHDYIVENTSYTHNRVGYSFNGLWGTAYGCIVQGGAICQGYAEAFNYFMKLLDIECGMVSGTAGDTGHIWNYVNLEGEYYWIDVTWDDPDEQGDFGNDILHSYFLVDDEHLLRTREISSEDNFFVPECSSMKENYFVRNRAFIRDYSLEAVRDALLASPAPGKAEIMFGSKNAYDEALEDLMENERLWELSDYVDISDTVEYTADEDMYIIMLITN